MATAARSVPTLEVPAAADIMDLHSDSGLDFGDGDIDLDLRSTGPHDDDDGDDDMLLRDAGTDLGIEVQTASADQDDFMADHEDLIGDNLVIYDDTVVDKSSQHSMNTPGSEQQAPPSHEEDLIDYSDDEDEPAVNEHGSTSNSTGAHVDGNVTAESTDAKQTVVEEHDEAADAVTDEPSANEIQADDNQQDANGDYDDPQGQSYLDDAVDQQPENDVYADANAVSHADRPNEASLSGDTHQQAVYLHQVTVNYNDVELWLFKCHDLDDSGDYLLDDDSPTNKPMSSLLDACRTALGSVANDMEVGLRLDSFNNIELWQEHSSCAFITLEELVSLYLQLHAQDGTTDPESFYMTLLFRPRVSALISELRKAATDGIGHSGLRGAIDAGRTAFSAHLSHDSTEHHDSWENEEPHQEEESYGTSGLSADGAHDDEYQGNQDEKEREDFDREHDGEHHEESYEGNVDKASQPLVQSLENAAPESRADSTSDGFAEGASKTSTHDKSEGSALQGLTHQSPSNTQPSPHEEEDLLDYSDDEDGAATLADPAQARQPSSSSSTVQGDDKSYAQDSVQSPGDHEDYAEDAADASYDYQDAEADGTFVQDEAFDLGNGFDALVYDEEYNEGQEADNEKYGDAQELEGYLDTHATDANDENTNHYDDFGDQNIDQPVDFTGDDGDNAVESTVVEDDFDGVDNLLDLDAADTAADVSTHDQAGRPGEDDFIDFDDDADGEDGEAPVAASAAADPIVSSSSGLQNLSPSGQKRKIDEAGNDGGEATTSIDAKRPRV